MGRVQGCITGGRDGVRVDMHMALIPRSVMGGHVGLSAESITDGTQRLASGCPSPTPGGEAENSPPDLVAQSGNRLAGSSVNRIERKV